MIKHKYTKSCPECQGSGTVVYERPVRASSSVDSGFIEDYEDDCENCGGVGEIDDDMEEYDEERGDWLMHKRQDEEMDRD
jgi:DnaJ-class molecular chaperone